MTSAALFTLLASLADKDGAAEFVNRRGCWERAFGPWWVAVNGHKDTVKCSRGPRVAPFHCYVEFNGWPAALFTPHGGVMPAGTFAAALEAEITG